jgi:hypothetical protein
MVKNSFSESQIKVRKCGRRSTEKERRRERDKERMGNK